MSVGWNGFIDIGPNPLPGENALQAI
jgi:hypothetical protein